MRRVKAKEWKDMERLNTKAGARVFLVYRLLLSSGRVPNRFGTELSEPKVCECQAPKLFMNRM